MKIKRRFTFSAAHSLPHLPEGHKCRRHHGHNYVVILALYGPVGPDGMVVDFAVLDDLWEQEFKPKLDHQNLNETTPVQFTTAELLAQWIANHSKQKLFETVGYVFTVEVEVQETERGSAVCCA